MNTKRIIACVLLAASACWAHAQQQSPQMVRFLKEFPQRAAFNTHAYEFLPVPALTPVQGPYYRWEDVKAYVNHPLDQ